MHGRRPRPTAVPETGQLVDGHAQHQVAHDHEPAARDVASRTMPITPRRGSGCRPAAQRRPQHRPHCRRLPSRPKQLPIYTAEAEARAPACSPPPSQLEDGARTRRRLPARCPHRPKTSTPPPQLIEARAPGPLHPYPPCPKMCGTDQGSAGPWTHHATTPDSVRATDPTQLRQMHAPAPRGRRRAPPTTSPLTMSPGSPVAQNTSRLDAEHAEAPLEPKPGPTYHAAIEHHAQGRGRPHSQLVVGQHPYISPEDGAQDPEARAQHHTEAGADQNHTAGDGRARCDLRTQPRCPHRP